MERFHGILIEHYAGAFPTWLAPVQVNILPITTKHVEYAQKLADTLWNSGMRVEVDDRNEKVGYKMRESQMRKIPYILVVGDKEAENNTVAVRKHGENDSVVMAFDEFQAMIEKEIAEKAKVEVDGNYVSLLIFYDDVAAEATQVYKDAIK